MDVPFHMLFLDGVHQIVGPDAPEFRPVAAPDSSDLQKLVEQIAPPSDRRIKRCSPPPARASSM